MNYWVGNDTNVDAALKLDPWRGVSSVLVGKRINTRIGKMAVSDAPLSRPINTVSVLRTESDRVPQVFVSQPSVELRRTRSESQLARKPLDSLSMRSTTSAGLEDEVVSVYTVSSLDSELANEKLLPSFEEISDCNDTLTQNLLTPREKDTTLTPGMTLADIEKEAVASTMISRPSCVEEHVDKHAESGSSIASSPCFRPEDDLDDDMLLRCRPTSTRKQRLHATLRASKRRVLDLMQKRRVATASPSGDTVEMGSDAIDFSAVAISDRESPLAPSGKRSPVETHVVDKKEKVKKRKQHQRANGSRSPVLGNGHSTPSLHDSPTTSTGFIRSRSTRPVPLQENVLWSQSLHYDLDGTSSSSPLKTLCKYLNITVHAKELPYTPVVAGTNPASTDIGQTPVSELEPSQSILLGYRASAYRNRKKLLVILLFADHPTIVVALCKTKRALQDVVIQYPIDSLKSTPEFCRHAGYDPRLCYGDVTLGFRFFPGGFPSGAGALNTEESDEEIRIDETFVVTKAPTPSPASVISTNQHVWKTWTSKGTTICALCRGKIWLKSASCCQRCRVVCHHKCVERAASGIPCNPHAVLQEDKPFNEVDVDINAEGGTKEDYPPCDVAATSQAMQSSYDCPTRVPTTVSCLFDVSLRSRRIKSNRVEWNTSILLLSSVDIDNVAHKFLGDDVELTSRRVRLRNKMTEKLSSWRRGGKATAKQHLDAGGRDSHYSDFSTGVVSEKEELLSQMANIQDCLADILPTLDGSPFIRSLYFRPGDAYNEQTINHAKLLGKEIFSDLRGEERKAMINEQIDRIQLAIRETKEGQLTTLAKDETEKKSGNTFIGQDERLQALAVVMLHYCAALQDCESQGKAPPTAGTIGSSEVLETSAEGYSLSGVCSSTDEISNNIVVFEPTAPTTADDAKSTCDKLNQAFLVMTQEQDSLKEE
ncbi:unnamed protein product [Angiostrongylus costaricensis]|uniref:Phorbol-ester/DAG-type domain-containing protein n=1 Tax=Angiostrongylus costaricensis TaxID=334426 RepID=A0A158PKX1_ANGCS|nr:unnamed protein product [Angiostrongylus costaricensis]